MFTRRWFFIKQTCKAWFKVTLGRIHPQTVSPPTRRWFFIAMNTVKEIQREKMFYVLFLVFILLLGVGFVAGSLSLNEQKRLSINFAWTACHISLALMALYFGSHLISRELEKKTILLILTKPVLRWEFLVGKFIGLLFVLLLILCVLTSFVLLIHAYYKHPVNLVFFMAISGVFIEALLLGAFAFLFSVFLPAFLVLSYSFGVFIIGHFVSDLLFFVQQDETNSPLEGTNKMNGVQAGVLLIVRLLPNLERLNWRAHVLYQDKLSIGEWGGAMLYALCYIVFLLVLTNTIFRRAKLV